MAINVLSSDIYNKISAGEVVERPASIVKELVENSIDGGATRITIEILDGGIKQISVSDNGCGIEPEDIGKAFLPHATSKILNVSDLDNIASLGFRGEALASIASVSKVKMVSKTENNEYGISLSMTGGQFEEKKEVGAENGTRITVKDLFFNTPARLKFLKKPKSEEGEITHLVSRLILANPQLSIRYVVDDKIIYNTFGNGLAEALYIIYGKETYDNLLEVNYSRDDITVYGFIARPTYCKPNRTYQTLFVNGRVVSNYMISSAVQDAVDAFIMKGKFPLFALNISIPYSSVDVNVHPSKQEVKFENPGKIYSVVNTAIYKVVSSANYIQDNQGMFETKIVEPEEKELPKMDKKEGYSFSDFLNTNKTGDNLILRNNESILSKILCEKTQKNNEGNNFVLEEVEIISENSKNTQNNEINLKINTQQNKIEEVFDNFNIIGVLFETYILLEKDDSLIVIDQHAAHERQLYDKILAEIECGEFSRQELLVPYILNTNKKESEFLGENIQALIDFGIDISQFGENTFKVSAVPYILASINLKEFFELVLGDINSMMKKPLSFIKDKIARMACRAAVKGGDRLSKGEIQVLLANFKEDGNVLLCPHGRPIVLQFRKTEIEKWFKRIV